MHVFFQPAGAKYGADMPEVPGLLQLAKELGLQVSRVKTRSLTRSTVAVTVAGSANHSKESTAAASACTCAL
jgi:hypothetical protein